MPEPKRIVISINASWNIVNFRMGLIRVLQARGHEVVALAPHDAWSDRLAAAGVEFHPLNMNQKGVSPAQDAGLFLAYLKAMRRLRPDVFLGYTVKPNVYGSLAAHLVGARVVNNVSGLGTAFIREGFLTRLVSLLYRTAFRRSARVFFQNEEDMALFVQRRLVGLDKARLLPGSGIDLDRFRPAALPARAPGEIVFLLPARLLRDKGVVEYVEAARQLRAELPGARFQLLGFADAANRTAVSRAELDAWVGEGIVEYLGVADDVRPYMAAADCVVLPSYREGLPRVLLEAAAMGRPLVATDVPGCRQVVRNEVNGLLCRVADAQSLAAAMRRMAQAGPGQRSAWGDTARRMAERDYDERIVHAAYVEAIESPAQPR